MEREWQVWRENDELGFGLAEFEESIQERLSSRYRAGVMGTEINIEAVCKNRGVGRA